VNRFTEPLQRTPGTHACATVDAVSAGRPKRATIRDLAERTGLSPAAVSYALRGLQVSAETEARVRAAADELGYEVDPIARALRGGSTAVVGLLVGSLADFWHQELVNAVQRELRLADRTTLVADADGEPAREIELARRLVDHRVDGLIASPIGPSSDGWEAIADQVPTVAIGDALPGARTAGEVVFDNVAGVSRVLEHLHGLGHHHVLVLSWAIASAPARPTELAVAASAARLGMDCPVVPCAYSLNGSTPLAVEVLGGPAADRPTAVFCLSDSIAYGVYAACRELGLRIPEDVSVVGFDDHPMSRLLQPALTSVGWDTGRIAATATGFLVRSIADGTLDRRAVMPPLLAARASTGPARAA
jgi:LacI family transcriptional regulator